jgi:hypothetical protein
MGSARQHTQRRIAAALEAEFEAIVAALERGEGLIEIA